MSRKTTMGFAKWRIQVLRDDGSVSQEQFFLDQHTAFDAFYAMPISVRKRIQIRYPRRARYETLETEGA